MNSVQLAIVTDVRGVEKEGMRERERERDRRKRGIERERERYVEERVVLSHAVTTGYHHY